MSDFTDSYENASSNFCPGIVPGISCGDDKEEGSQYCQECNKSIQKLAKKSMKKQETQEKKTHKAEKEQAKSEKEQAKEQEKQKLQEQIKESRQIGDEIYSNFKDEFEKKFVMILGTYMQIEADGNITKISNAEMNNQMANKIIRTIDSNGKEKKEKFLTRWVEDEKRVDYDAIKFYPDDYKGERSEYKFYNLWNGFKINNDMKKRLVKPYYEACEKLIPELESRGLTQEECDVEFKNLQNKMYQDALAKFDEKRINELIQPILTHLDFITGGNKEFMLKWMAKIIQKPGQKTEVAPLIRDIASFFTDSGGIGKNLFIDFFGKRILGERYYHVVSENKELYENFNTSYRGKLLVFVEEAGGAENFQNKDALKSRITKVDISVQAKSKDRYTCADFCNYIFTTNNANPLPIDKRRFAVFDSFTDKRGDEAYFTQLAASFENFDVCFAFYLYLKNLDTWKNPIETQNAIPDTLARRELIKHSTPVFVKWLSDFSTLCFLEHRRTATETYDNFANWFRNAREGSESHIMKKTEFFNRINKEDKIFKKTKNSNIYYEANLDYVIPQLINLHLLPKDYTLEDAKLEKNLENETRKI